MCVSLRTLCVSTKPKRRVLTGIRRGLGRSADGEDFVRQHKAEVPNAEQAFGERAAGKKKQD